MSSILRHAWLLYRQNFIALTLISLIVWIPCDLFSSWMEYHVLGNNPKASIDLSYFFDAFIGIIALSGSYYFLRERTSGRTAGIGMALRAGFTFWGPMFLTRFIVGVGFLFGILLLFIPGIYFAVRMAVVEVVVVAEEISGLNAARRSHQLTKGKFWQILIWFAVGMFPMILLAGGIVGISAWLPFSDNWMIEGIESALSDVLLSFIFPLGWAVYARLLADEAARKSILEEPSSPIY
jgi:hypothetical protein